MALVASMNTLDKARSAAIASHSAAMGNEWHRFSQCTALEADLVAMVTQFGTLLAGEEAPYRASAEAWRETVEDCFIDCLGMVAAVKVKKVCA